MRELLLSKGFIFNDYDYNTGNFYEYTSPNGHEDTKRLAKIFGFEDDDTDEDLLICCDESFTEFTVCCYSEQIDYTMTEFKRLVEKM